jgi:hypothetical protein
LTLDWDLDWEGTGAEAGAGEGAVLARWRVRFAFERGWVVVLVVWAVCAVWARDVVDWCEAEAQVEEERGGRISEWGLV